MRTLRNGLWLLGGLTLLAWTPVGAQEPDMPPERLRQQIMERFLMNYRQLAGLTEDQFRQFQQVALGSWQARRTLEQRERQLFRALEGQLRPGIAAQPDSVRTLLDSLLAVQETRLAQARRDQEAYAQFLSPVQRAQLVLMTARFEHQIEEILRRRMEQRRFD